MSRNARPPTEVDASLALGRQLLERAKSDLARVDSQSDDAIEVALAVLQCCSLIASLSEVSGRKADGEGPLLQAVRWARDRLVHDLMIRPVPAAGAVFPVVYPMQYAHWRWATRVELGTPSRRFKHMEDAYDAQLADHSIRSSLHAAARALDE